MKLKLIVLAGAKEGLEIPLKKDKFLIGRAKECALCAGSEAISRRHCAIIRRETGWTVRDLGSRNGTHVNDEKITTEVPLKDGRRTPRRSAQVSRRRARVVNDAASAGLSRIWPRRQSDKPRKQPPVKDVADVVERTISNSDSATRRRRLSLAAQHGRRRRGRHAQRNPLDACRRYQHDDESSLDDRRHRHRRRRRAIDQRHAAAEESPAAPEGEEEGSGVWKFLKRGKAAAPKKKEPGKLPPREEQKSKDSRAAAADILREMQRRR